MDGPPAPPMPSVGQLPTPGDIGSINPNDDGKSGGSDSEGDDNAPPASNQQGPLPIGNGGDGNKLPGGLLPGGPQGQAPAGQEQPNSNEKGTEPAAQSNARPSDAAPSDSQPAASGANAPAANAPQAQAPQAQAPAADAPQSNAPQSHDTQSYAPQADNGGRAQDYRPAANNTEADPSDSQQDPRDSRSQIIAPQSHKSGPVRTGKRSSRRPSTSSGHARTHRTETSGSPDQRSGGHPWWSDGNGDYGSWLDDSDDAPDGGGGGGS
ncbi:MAG: hypothetical protein JO144_16260 [Actinobacteria bacterium]|nr:hypothetical protein [Actinomycetota bacterium]